MFDMFFREVVRSAVAFVMPNLFRYIVDFWQKKNAVKLRKTASRENLG